jgi:hypothetical protein
LTCSMPFTYAMMAMSVLCVSNLSRFQALQKGAQ